MLSSAGTFLKVIIWTTISIFLITIFLIVYDYFRRLSREKYYQKLDKDREKFYKIFSNFFKLENFSEEAISDLKSELVISSSTERQALLEILIKFSQRTPNLIYSLAKELGYIEEYEKKLSSPKPYERGRAFRILGELNSKSSLEIMLKTLTKENNQNAVFVGFLSISKLIDETHFLIFLYILEEKLEKNILNLKAVSLIITDFIDRHKRKASLAIYDFMKNIDVFKPCRLALLDGISLNAATKHIRER